MSEHSTVAIPITLMNSIMEYLGSKPYSEVANLITAIEAEAVTVALEENEEVSTDE